MKRKRILYLSPVSPLVPFSGYQQRAFHILRYLASRHEVDLIACGPKAPKPDPCRLNLGLLRRYRIIPEPRRGWLGAGLALFRSYPYHVQLYSATEMKQAIIDWLSRYEYDCIYMCRSQLMSVFLERKESDYPPIVVDQHAAEPDVWKNLIQNDPRWAYRAYALANYFKVMRFERGVFKRATATIAITERDKELTLQHHPHVRVLTVPSGINPDEYVPSSDPQYDFRMLLFSGTGAMRNVNAMRWYVEKVHPIVKAQCPQVKVLWIGNVDRSTVPFFTSQEGVRMTGFVEHTAPYFDKGMIFIAPFRMGEGMKAKIIEAMTMGKVIVSTPMGVQGIDISGMPFVRVGDTPESFAKEILHLLENRKKTNEWGASARTYAIQHFAWDVLLAPLEGLFENLHSI